MHRAAADELAGLGDADYRRVRTALETLGADPAGRGLDVKRLTAARGGAPLCRLRVGTRRVLYAMLADEKELLVLVVQRRGLGYDRLLALAEARMR